MISMNLKIINKTDNPSLSRKEVQAQVEFFNEPTPKKEDVKKKIASMEKADEKLVVIKGIGNSFGVGKGDVFAYIYKSEKELKEIEPKKKEKKEKPAKGAAPKAGAKKEAPKKEEAPKEEAPKEKAKEAPKEEKKEAPKEAAKK